MNSRSHGIFWIVLQITLLTTWAILLLAGERYIPDDTLRTAMDASGLALMAAGLLLAGFGVFKRYNKPAPEAGTTHAGGGSRKVSRNVVYAVYGGIILMMIGATLFFPTVTGALFVPVVIVFFYIRNRNR